MSMLLAILLLISCNDVEVVRNPATPQAPTAANPIPPVPPPAGAVVIGPADDIQGAVNNNPPGTAFLLKTGVHRLQTVSPKDGDTFTGEVGATLSGAKLLTSFEREGRYWVAGGQTQHGPVHGYCLLAFPMCGYPEDLFFDDLPLQHAPALDEVIPGKWYFDYRGAKIYFADNPAGHKIEASVTAHAFYGPAKNVSIRGLIIEKYSNDAQTGAIQGADGQGWVIENSEIRLNHAAGVRLGNQMTVRGNYVHHNGQIGAVGIGDGILVEGNEIAFNNFAGFSSTWEAGGIKFVLTNNLIVRRNFAHNNQGPGLWTDTGNRNCLYEYNRTRANSGSGIVHEISFAATIRYNTIEDEAPGLSGRQIWGGAGIFIAASSDVEIYGNTVVNSFNGIAATQQDRGSDPSGVPYLVTNLNVHDNTIVQMSGTAAGIVAQPRFNNVFTAWNNHYTRNTYQLGSLRGRYFQWLDAARTKDQWQAFGNDVNGAFSLCNSRGYGLAVALDRSSRDLRSTCTP